MSTRRSSRAASKAVNYNDDKEVDETATAPEPPKRRQRSQSPAQQKKKAAAAERERERSPAQQKEEEEEHKSSTKADHEEKKEVAAEHEEQKTSEKQLEQQSQQEEKSAESKETSDSSSKSQHSAEDQDIIDRFWDEVNMDADELDEWLQTDESKQVGWSHDGEGESVGHKSGRTIVQILRKGKDNVTDDEIAHMRKVHSYLARHMAQGHRLKPENVEDSKWRKSLKNWGVDPVEGGSSIAKS